MSSVSTPVRSDRPSGTPVHPLKWNTCAGLPLQVQICSCSPSRVMPLGSSRHSPDCGLYSDPSDRDTQSCPPTPLQSHSSTLVPGAVPLPSISRHWPIPFASDAMVGLPLYTHVHCWSTAFGSQPHTSTIVPSWPPSSPPMLTHCPPASVIVCAVPGGAA